jgi:hypothetical protein
MDSPLRYGFPTETWISHRDKNFPLRHGVCIMTHGFSIETRISHWNTDFPLRHGFRYLNVLYYDMNFPLRHGFPNEVWICHWDNFIYSVVEFWRAEQSVLLVYIYYWTIGTSDTLHYYLKGHSHRFRRFLKNSLQCIINVFLIIWHKA